MKAAFLCLNQNQALSVQNRINTFEKHCIYMPWYCGLDLNIKLTVMLWIRFNDIKSLV